MIASWKKETRELILFLRKKNNNENNKNPVEIEEDDNAFLSAALSKARRLQRLRDLNIESNGLKEKNGRQDKSVKGADAVVQSICSMKNVLPDRTEVGNDEMKANCITFELDATKEFTRALRSQRSQANNISVKTVEKTRHHISSDTQLSSHEMNVDPSSKLVNELKGIEEDEPASLEELADQIKEDHQETAGGFGDTASTVPVGRGLSNFLSMLKHTGDITGKNAGKEELRGRAKDERNYEDYEELNLKDVVKFDTSQNNRSLHKKDVEFANREIKLEYRDEHGRLLTRKEAYRNLCYQFHGHGSSKKNEEKRLKQVERERKEGSLASRHDNSGTLGALKATQRATGKAFVLHKT